VKVLLTLLAVAGVVGGCASTQMESNPAGDSQSTAPATPPDVQRVVMASPPFIVPPVAEYSAASRKAREQGVVIVRAFIDVNGRPSQASVLRSSGYATLDESATSAVRKSRLRPYTKDGIAQPVWVTIPIGFWLESS